MNFISINMSVTWDAVTPEKKQKYFDKLMEWLMRAWTCKIKNLDARDSLIAEETPRGLNKSHRDLIQRYCTLLLEEYLVWLNPQLKDFQLAGIGVLHLVTCFEGEYGDCPTSKEWRFTCRKMYTTDQINKSIFNATKFYCFSSNTVLQ
jgi:hypothetical protein